MTGKELAYIDNEGDLIVKDAFDGDILVSLASLKSPEDIVRQLWRLSTKNNLKSEALKQAIEIMSKHVGLIGPGGDWVGNG